MRTMCLKITDGGRRMKAEESRPRFEGIAAATPAMRAHQGHRCRSADPGNMNSGEITHALRGEMQAGCRQDVGGLWVGVQKDVDGL